MCGLVGYSGPDNFDVDKIKVLLLWNSFERGQDSTGLYSPINGLKKSVLSAPDFVISKDAAHEIVPDNFLIGHVRHATIGGTSAKNAHPFLRGNCVLAHNGTLKNHYALLREFILP